jgi:hypothetical protein
MNKKCLQSVLPVLKVLKDMKAKDRQILIPFLVEKVTEAIYECIYNATTNNEMSIEKRKEIKKHTIADKEIYRYLLKPKTNKMKRQKKLHQIGGDSLGLILQTVVPELESILKSEEVLKSEKGKKKK